ncbi:ABC transporter substrate-binding protein [Ochrobactrum vermis]|uniref:ABC transporter substrate-binding protein n=1 Tax=Ochrobactrum vermis TaxID=1827297 RepID=A0ABU8PLW1_9HYPH|nr:ABC transporter substrate-binding protein [Ochrobactrum vermis]PQZ26859.1 peptide ABC transporter substrate-binding protein [Ochrobactrum vermis]
MDDNFDNRSLLSGGFSRRKFLKASVTAGVGLTFGQWQAGTALADETPKRGGHLKIGLSGGASTDSLDPATYISSFALCLSRSWGDTLVQTDPKTGAALPNLAESWVSSPDSQTWTFKIRKNVKFHDGSLLTAEDAAQTLRRHSDKKSRSGALGFLSSLENISVKDGDLVLKLNEPNIDLPLILNAYHLVVQPGGGIDNPAAGIGTGPYRIASFQPGVRVLLERNKDGWRDDRGYVDSVELLVINDVTARTAALTSGQVHLINQLSAKTVPLLKRVPNVEIVNVPGRGHVTFPMRCDTGPFTNPDLRMAMKYAIDREQMLRNAFGGFGTIGNDFPINTTYPNFPADIEQRAYDPDKAAFHFKKANYDGPIVLQASNAVFAGAVDAAILLQASAKAAGIQVDVKREPEDGYWTNVWRVAPFCMSYYGSRLTQDLMYSTENLSTAATNETYFNSPQLDGILKSARAEKDEDKRKTLYQDAAVIVRDQGGSLIPIFNNYISAKLNSVKGYVEDVGNDLSNGYVTSRVWLES